MDESEVLLKQMENEFEILLQQAEREARRLIETDENNSEMLIELAEQKAFDLSDGHVTLMRFTTGWKIFGGSPDLTPASKERLSKLRVHETLEDALSYYICAC